MTFVLGGAASGKSAWAEKLIETNALKALYLATGQIFDEEIKLRVKRHQDRRDARWRTVEAPFDPAAALVDQPVDEPVLLDCATMWLSNHILAENPLAPAQEALLAGLSACAAPVVVVSNEVGHGIVPDNALARAFREAQGRLNIALAAQADLAVLVVAGLPQVLKGQLP
ncbi:MAG: bifunctional adenosylcobinamide kinase/adenosylcobinamide-phosphate guanylyltransferase [Pseudomonadota bacterium]